MLNRHTHTIEAEIERTFLAFDLIDCPAVFTVDEKWASGQLIDIGDARLLTWNPPGGEERLPRAFAVKLMGEDEVRRQEMRITEEYRDSLCGWSFHRREA